MPRRRVQCLLVAVVLALGALNPLAASAAPVGGSGSAADPACVAETEPNDHEGDAGTLSGPVCVKGTLPEGDQDLFVWDVSGQPAALWNFSLTGVYGEETGLKVLAITSDPGVTPVVAGTQLGQIVTQPLGGPESAADILIAPGRYLLGMTRTASGGGTLPDTSYSFQIAPGSPMPANRDKEPNDDTAHAIHVGADLSLSGDSANSDDEFLWTPPAGSPRWQIELQGPLGTQPVVVLRDRDGNELAKGFGDPSGKAWLHDLVLGSKPVIVDVAGTGATQAYVLAASPETFQGGDPEPDNNAQTAIALDPANLTATGRLSDSGDIDDYTLHVDDHLASLLLDVKVIWRAGPGRQVCLFDSTGIQLSCRAQDGADLLGNLLLPVGDYTIEVRGDPSPDDLYLLRVDATSPPSDQFETEPNDVAVNASSWTAGVTMHGRGSTSDIDTFRLTVSGAPQLYELDAAGQEIDNVIWETRDGTQLEAAEVTHGNTSASLEDMYLVPGDHWIDVRAVGDYALTLTPLGPPDPNSELEPNNDSLHAQALALNTPRTGRIVRFNDVDFSRFSLQAAERLKLHIQPPADGSLRWTIQSGSTTVAQAPAGEAGAPMDTDLSLPAGDYELWISGGDPSTGTYTLEVDREDPFASGTPLAATLSVALGAPGVAAYWDAGQHLDATLTVTNTGTASEDLSLDAVTSDQRWAVSLSSGKVTVAAGATATVPVIVTVPPDAWADVPVRISVRAADSSGEQATGFVNVTPTANEPPVAPYQAWSVPDALLGGLDVAATALGAAPVVQYDPTMEAQLYDGYTPAGAGLDSVVTLPATFTTDLAGDAELPIAGMIVNPQARNADINDAPKDVELLLSDDGSTWTSVLKGTMTPLGVDQSFVLPSPVNARFARLQVDSTYGDGARVAVGEFKVLATPGTAIPPAGSATSGPLNVADPVLGGHIVTIDPPSGTPQNDETIIDASLYPAGDFAKAGVHPSWVVGFWNDRAAQLEGLRWLDPTVSYPTNRFTQVQVETSTDSPLGPWTDQGTWKLKRNGDGSVNDYPFPQPVWARYVRFTADAAKVDLLRELPGQVQVLEVPIDATNRSVVGEYGPTPAGPYELANPPALSAPSYAPDANDTPDSATPLTEGQTASSTVHTGQDVDWYDVVAPAGQNTLTFTVQGTPRVGTSLQLVDDAGVSVPMTFAHGDDPGSVTYTAPVTPGARYRVEVQQPPFSVVFTFDTSGSMGNYLPFVYEAIHSFSDALVPGAQAVKILPFELPSLLPDWTDDKYALQDALEGILVGGGSSAAETSLLNATDELATREGATAVVTVTDADTTSYDHSAALWQALAKVRPLVFSIHVAADSVIVPATELMQDWAYSSGGFYQYTRSHGEMDRAFDRMATWLERPTEYTLSYATSFVPPPKPSTKPGTLQVVGANQGDPSKVPVASNVAIELILDTSGSMLDRFEGRRRIDVAQTVLTHLVRDKLPVGVPLALRVFGDTPSSCDTRLAVPLGPLNPDQVISQIDGIHILASVNTPIGDALKQVASDLGSVSGPKIVVLMTDGEENCGGNPSAAVKALAKAGVDVHVNIVGFQIGQASLRKQMAGWAKVGHGSFFNAITGADLNAALALAMSAPYRVLDKDGKVVATGTVNGTPLTLKPGSYHVVVLTEPQIEFDATIEAGKPLVLSLPSSANPPSSP